MDVDKVETQVEKWLSKMHLKPPGNADLSRVRLVHLGTKASELWETSIDDDFNAKTMAFEIVSQAAEDAEGMGGFQKYKVEGFFGASKKAGRIKRFALDAREDIVDDEFSEPATSKGILTQMMRHNEVLMRSSAGSMNAVVTSLMKQNAVLTNRLLTMEEKYSEMITVRERLLTEETEREVIRVQSVSAEKRKDEMLESIKLLLPSVIEKVGGKMLPSGENGEKPDLTKAKVAMLAKSIKPEQLSALSSVFSQAQLIALMELMKDAGES